MLALKQGERRAAYETIDSPEDVPTYSTVPVRGPEGEVLDGYRGVQRDDTHEVVSVVSARYGLVGHRDVASAVHQVGEALEVPDRGLLPQPFRASRSVSTRAAAGWRSNSLWAAVSI